MDLASVEPTPRSAAFSRGTGEFAADYLRAAHFTRWVVEVDYPVGRQPSASALAALQTQMQERCDKPDGVTFVLDEALPANTFDATTTADEIAAIESQHRSTFSDVGTRTAASYLIYVHGHSDLDQGDSAVIGVAYRAGSCAVYADRVDESASPPSVTGPEIEASVLVHEFGHLLGLVNGGVPMTTPHEDEQHPFHDVDQDCVMYFQLSVGLLIPNLGDPLFAQFDARCMEDLAAFGGRPATVLPKRDTHLTVLSRERRVVGACGCPSCLAQGAGFWGHAHPK